MASESVRRGCNPEGKIARTYKGMLIGNVDRESDEEKP